uniref:Uncharacterized protein n=1 Tax=Knipowitschia caucasica TaxID=637954 RepID=A0AAV2LEK9_KNICA
MVRSSCTEKHQSLKKELKVQGANPTTKLSVVSVSRLACRGVRAVPELEGFRTYLSRAVPEVEGFLFLLSFCRTH